MPREKHDAWVGHDEIEVPNARPGQRKKKARCQQCSKILCGITAQNLTDHKVECNKKSRSANVLSRALLSDLDRNSVGIIRSCAQKTSSGANEDPETVEMVQLRRDPRLKRLLYFCIDFGIDFDQLIESSHSENSFQALDNSFKIPRKLEILKNILPKAISDFRKEMHSSEYRDYMVAVIDYDSNFNYLASFAITNQGKYILMGVGAIKRNSSEYVSPELEQEISAFLDQSVVLIRNQLGIAIKYVMHAGTTGLERVGFAGDSSYHRFTSIYDICEELLKNHGGLVVDNSESLRTSEIYFNSLEKGQEKTKSQNYSIASAIEDIFELVDKNILSVNKNAMVAINRLLSPVFLAENYLHCTHKGHYFHEFDAYKKVLNTFMRKECPKDAYDAFGEYKDSKDYFDMDPADLLSDPIDFWEKAKMHSKSLS
ncbi:hypothetical protein QAD02_002456 [Eretmocerus hayati]|uniref:Uncharacterized protein n=1 Tax=Eretmocerus hayati TaxID=131215 RepID=A0ACC2NJB0_9HYME|nr:hypothetical protein QAD02_002456 [Eretmocerus hayati]